ncbi:trans-aconitate 2-methyltransferase [Actinoplanes sp. DH11]|uniref:class I SAM-dependent methyltransferase n=1 Tax=Actinoplanes sp. DH11 TaxID=2857011 RepID=UPI001E3E5CF2|nr:class I SAM-dependent methyltransferase [Actinoplanes sp. DH11]
MASTSPPRTLPQLDPVAVDRWRRGWDEVMAGFLPGAASCEAAVLAVAEAVCGPGAERSPDRGVGASPGLGQVFDGGGGHGRAFDGGGGAARAFDGGGGPARVLDLGGGPGVFAERMARRWPAATVGLVDLDPVLLALAAAGSPGRVTLHPADLAADWAATVDGPYDLITAVMAVHYLPPGAARDLYRAARSALRPGGLLIVADLMPDPGLTGVMGRLHPAAGDAAAGLAWTRWWEEVRAEDMLAPALREREQIFARRVPAEFTPPVDWHRAAAHEVGFTESGIVWRWGAHAALAAVA